MRIRQWIERLGRFVDKFTNNTGFVVSFVVISLIGMITYEVVIRYVFHQPTVWAHESTQLVFAVYTAFGGAYTLYQGAHVRVDIFYKMFPPRTRQIAAIVIFAIFMMISVILLWQVWGMTQSSLRVWERSSSAWAPPLYPAKVLLLVAVILLLIQGIVTFSREVHRAKNLGSNSGVTK